MLMVYEAYVLPSVCFLINSLVYSRTGPCCCVGACSSCMSRAALCHSAQAPHCSLSLVAGHRLSAQRLRELWASLLCSMWNLPRPGSKPVSPCIGKWSPIHCTTWEVLSMILTYCEI